MKKNLLSILILALLIVNIVLTSIMMFSVTNASNKTAALVTDIASIIKLDIGEVSATEETVAEAVSIKDVVTYNIADKMTIPLKSSADGKEHYALVSVTIGMNAKADGYKEYGELIAEKDTLIQGIINEVFNTYTIEELKDDQTAVRKEIVGRLQELYDSKFIYDVTFSSIQFS